jgi:23S rRNA G2069 N7-methylase RlmK/C1962 C5-methylase RlmI
VNPDLVCDAHRLTEYLDKKFDVILADPPYSNLESKELYGTPKINYKKWSKEAKQLLNSGGLLIVYHKYIMPNPDADMFKVVKRVFIGSRTYHLLRAAIYFQKKKGEL